MNRRAKPDSKIMKRLLSYILKKYRLACIFVLFFIILSSLANVVGSLFIKNLIDDYIVPYLGTANPDFRPLFQAICTMAVIYLVGIVSTYVYNKILIVVSQGTIRDVRDDLFEYMEQLPIRYFDTHAHGDIMSIYTNDTDTLRQLISQSFPQMVVSFITIISVFFSMLFLNVILTVITLLVAAVMLFVARKVAGKSGKYFMAQQQDIGVLNGFVEEMMEGSKVIKVFTHEQKSIEAFKEVNGKLCDSATNANIFANILMPLLGNLGYVSYVLTAIFGSALAISGIGGLSLGTIASFLQLNRSFNQPIGQISQQLNAVVMALAGASRIFALMDEEIEEDKGKVTLVNVIEHDGAYEEVDYITGVWAWRQPCENGEAAYVKLSGDVRFQNVTFGYDDNKTVLHDVSLFAKPGQKIAFVGATGAGKTTITNLINRFYDVQNGSITYDGIDVKQIKKADLRRSLGIVLQDTNLFTGTIMDNIRYGRLDATDEECIAAAKLANAHEFIKHLEHGYQTMLHANGSSLSQGQRQLLSIARAAVANPPVLILDEATSSIDTRTERIVQDGMDKLMWGRTVFVIAHRLSTIKNSNAIMVLENGLIKERGDHDDLIEQKGIYYQLYTGAFELD